MNPGLTATWQPSLVSRHALPVAAGLKRTTLADVVTRLPLFADLPNGALSGLIDNLFVVDLAPNDYFDLTYEEPAGYLVPIKGRLLFSRSHWNKQIPVNIPLPINTLWPINRPVNEAVWPSVLALSEAQFGILRAEGLQRLCRDSAPLRFVFLKGIVAGLNSLEDELAQRHHLSLTLRLARLLLELKQPAGPDYAIPFTHRQLAQMLSVHRESLTLALGHFRRQGWLTTERGAINLSNVSALEALVAESI